MTAMSRSSWWDAERWLSAARRLMWPATCMPMVACFYATSIPEPFVNFPPDILIPDGNADTVRVRTLEQVQLYVEAQDDNEEVFIKWPDLLNVPHTVQPGYLEAEGTYWSLVTIFNPCDGVPIDLVEAQVRDRAGNLSVASFTIVGCE